MSRTIAVTVVAAALLAACGEERLIDRPEDPPLVDRFEQRKASSIDILFVVDNSRTMAEERQAVAENIAAFVDYIDPDPSRTGEAGEVDYRIAVTTTDANRSGGALVRAREQGAPLVIAPGPGSVQTFQKTIAAIVEGGALEQGFEAAVLALENAGQLRDPAGKPLFLRPGAYLYVIIVTDEEDRSSGEVRYWYRRFEGLKGKGNENTVAVSAIAGPVPDGCETAEAGKRYAEIARLTGGVLGNICTTDWSATLQQLAVTGVGLRKRFQLRESPRDRSLPEGIIDWADLEVRIQYPCSYPPEDPHLSEEVCAPPVERSCSGGSGQITCYPYYGEKDGWSFDPRENSVVFDGAAVPGAGSVIEVEYLPRDK